MLITSTRSLSVSFQGEAFSLPISKKKERTPVRDQRENSKPVDKQQLWPGASRRGISESASRDVDCECDDRGKKLGSMLHHSLIDGSSKVSIDGRLALDLGEGDGVLKLRDESKTRREFTASDTDSVSSGSTNGAQECGERRSFIASAKFWQDTNTRLRRSQDPSPSSRISSTSSKLSQSKRFSSDSLLVASPRGAATRPASPSDQLAIGKETGRRLGMGTNMYPSAALLGTDKNSNIASIPVEELIEKADGFAGVFPEHKYEIVKKLQERKHIVGMTGDGVNDAPALKKADIGIAVADATDAARGASDIVLTEPGLSVIISAVLTSRAIFQRMKNYTIYAVSITIRIVFGFMLIALIWEFDFSAFMVLIIAILNDGTIMTISKDRVKPSPTPDSWKLKAIFATGIVLGGYQAVMSVVFFWAIHKTDFFSDKFGVRSIRDNNDELMGDVYLQVSIISQALIFITRSRSWSFVERPGALLMIAFFIAQLVATLIAVYADWTFAKVKGIGWGWAGVIWVYSIVTYFPQDLLKFAIRYILSGKTWKRLETLHSIHSIHCYILPKAPVIFAQETSFILSQST